MGAFDSRVQAVEYGPTTKVQYGEDQILCVLVRWLRRIVSASEMANRVMLAIK